MTGVLADLRSGLRALRTAPSFAFGVIGTLTLCIGAATAMFSVVDGVLLKALPVEDEARLLIVWTSQPHRGGTHWPFSYASFEGMRERLRTVSGVAAHPYAGTLPAVLHLEDGSALPLQRTAVTGDWFGVLGVRPRAGRVLTAADDHVGAPPVIVLSSDLAERLFGGVGQSVGRRLRVDETFVTVVGVSPADFAYPRGADAWVPAAGFRDVPEVAWDLVVRIAPGFTTPQVAADLTSAVRTLPPQTGPLGPIDANQMIETRAFADDVVGDARPGLFLLAGGVLLVFLVGGVNVANLLLGRGLARRREFAIRAAIGASQTRLLQQIIGEAVVWTSLAAATATVVAIIALAGLLALAPADVPRVNGIGIDGRALAFTAGVALLAVALFATLPAVHAARVEPMDALRTLGGSAPGRGGRRLRQGLVVAQIAMAMLVVSAAGLLLRSLDRLRRLDVGFAAQDVFLADIAVPPGRYPTPADLQRAMVRLAELAAQRPGIAHATAVVAAPFAGTQGVDMTVFAEGQRLDDARRPLVNYEGADAAYFTTLGLPILRGRGIERQDRTGTQPVVVVNEAFARLFWPGQDPIGRRIKWGTATSKSHWRVVVGLVADARYRDLTTVRPSVYVPYEQGIPVSPTYLALRATNPGSIAGTLRGALAEQEPGASLVSMAPMPQLLAAPLARPQFEAALAGCFATLGLVLSIVGTYGTLSFFVRQRGREIGIRLALGAGPSSVRRLVLQQGLTMGVAGLLLGTGLVFALSRLLQPSLFGTTPADPLVLTGAAASLLAAVLAASALPIRAATRTNPLSVLRGE